MKEETKIMLSEEAKQKLSQSVAKRWEDPEYRAKQEASRAQAGVRRSATMKEIWLDPTVRQRRVDRLANPETRAKMSASHSEVMKELWKDPAYRAKRSKQSSDFAKTRQGINHPAHKHGMHKSPEYNAYSMAKYRCRNSNAPNWLDYGGRGIEFRFESFEQFLADVGPRPSPKHSLERLENNGHYEPGNVKWATDKEQVRNRRPNRRNREMVEIEIMLRQILGPDSNGKSPLEMIEMLRKVAYPDIPEYGLQAC